MRRRDFLRAAGALAVPPFLRHAVAAPGELPPPLVLLRWANGTNQSGFWPDADFRSPILDPILTVPDLASRTTLVKGVGMPDLLRGLGNEHDRGFHSFWTGVQPVGTTEESWAGGPSLDQVLKRRLALDLPQPTLNAGVLAAWAVVKNRHRASFSYVGARHPVPTQTDPYRLFAALFPERPEMATGEAAVALARHRLVERRSVLDFVARDVKDLAGRLPARERSKLDQHAAGLRELERRLGETLTPACTATGPAPGLDPRDEAHVPALAEHMLRIVAQALACNVTRIVTFQFGYCGHQWRYGWLGINRDGHHTAHQDWRVGGNPEAAALVRRFGNWHAQQVADFAKVLQAQPGAGGGSLLDDSLLVWTNENASGDHAIDRDVPVVILGRAGGRLTRTGFVVDSGDQPNHRVSTSVLHLMGVPADGYGDRPDCGPLAGLPVRAP